MIASKDRGRIVRKDVCNDVEETKCEYTVKFEIEVACVQHEE